MRRSSRPSPLRLGLVIQWEQSVAADPSASPDIAGKVEALMQQILGAREGYLSSSVMYESPSNGTVTVLHYFTTLSKVTTEDVKDTIDHRLLECMTADPGCGLLPYSVSYQNLSLCEFEICDPVSTTCSFRDGLAGCQCLPGYAKFYAADRGCRACGSGFQYRDGACVRCPFGFSGFNCEEPFLLALIVVSCAAGIFLCLLLILGVCLSHSRKTKLQQTPHRFQNAVLGMPHHAEVLRLPRARSIWSRGVGGTGEDSGFSTYEPHPSMGSAAILTPSEVLMRTIMESQASSTQHGHQNLGFDSEELDWPNVF